VNLESILFSQGFGSRRQCRALIEQARVAIHGAVCADALAEFDTTALVFTVDDVPWTFHAQVYLALNKPAGYECSRAPQHHASVFDLLPMQFAARGVQCAGRLDQDTTGLLLLSDDGQFLHECTSPRRKVPKTYIATTSQPIDDMQIRQLRCGVILRGESQPVAAVSASAREGDAHTLELTIGEGKYHQVKRMIAAVGNHLDALHRQRIGSFTLPDALRPGQWMWLDDAQRAASRNRWG